ncbi:MAG: hypothetical protein ACI9J3_001593 [Parvicellaceae bacterium]|jgi:hypothetical protein
MLGNLFFKGDFTKSKFKQGRIIFLARESLSTIFSNHLPNLFFTKRSPGQTLKTISLDILDGFAMVYLIQAAAPTQLPNSKMLKAGAAYNLKKLMKYTQKRVKNQVNQLKNTIVNIFLGIEGKPRSYTPLIF